VVVQLHGTKAWRLFPPGSELYGTRTPYEESSVFSLVPMAERWGPLEGESANKFPAIQHVEPWEVELNPGDVLYVPRHWWHYVSSPRGASVSVNMWLDHEGDGRERVLEAIARVLVCGLRRGGGPGREGQEGNAGGGAWLAPSEEAWPASDNLLALSAALALERGVPEEQLQNQTQAQAVGLAGLIDAATARPALEAIAARLGQAKR